MQWTFENITEPQLEETLAHVHADSEKRREYLETAFTQVITDLSGEINQLQGKLFTDPKVSDKIQKKMERLKALQQKKHLRLGGLQLIAQLNPKVPEVIGCAYVVPLTQVEYLGHYGMSRDDEAEAIAMQTVMDYEKEQGWTPEDVSANNEGYDIRSISAEGIKRYIEVKGRSGEDGSVMLSENEWNRLAQLGKAAWLYIVTDCKVTPKLFRLPDPANSLLFEQKSKGIQYFLPMNAWRTKGMS